MDRTDNTLHGYRPGNIESKAESHGTYGAVTHVDFVFMIGTHQSQRLTSAYLAFILCPLSQKTKVGPSLPDNQGRNWPLFTVVFLCPHILKTGLIRLVSIMAGCIGLPLKGWAGSLAGSEIPIQSAAQRFSLVGGGYSLYQGVTA